MSETLNQSDIVSQQARWHLTVMSILIGKLNGEIPLDENDLNRSLADQLQGHGILLARELGRSNPIVWLGYFVSETEVKRVSDVDSGVNVTHIKNNMPEDKGVTAYLNYQAQVV